MSHASESSGPGRVKQIAGYTLDAKIGQGGMGVVFKATDQGLNRPVALKVLPPKFSENERFVGRFLREARSAARLQHPNIVKAYDVGHSPEGYYYFAMEFIEGESLQARIQRQGALPERDATAIILGVAQGLAHAEGIGMVHRDIKPDNILIDREGTPKITDFGLAKTEEDPTVTQAGGIIGSPHYMSPEQAKGAQTLDPRTDIYSLGATFFHAVTGKPPYLGDTAAVIIYKHFNDPVPSAREQNPAVSENTSKVIQKMMAKEASARYQTAAELMEDLEKLLRGEAPSVAVGRTPKLVDRRHEAILERGSVGKKSSAMIYVAAGVVGAMLIGVILFLMNRAPAPERRAMAPTPAPRPAKAPASPTSAPKPPTTAVAPGPANKDAEAALQLAEAYSAANPEYLSERLERYQAVLDEFGSSPAAAKAAEAVKSIQAQWDAKAQAALDTLKREADALAAEQKFGGAMAAFDGFPQSLINERWSGEIENQRDGYRRAAAQALDAMRQESAKRLAEGQFEEAKRAFEPALVFEMEDVAEEARAEMAKIDEQREKAASEAEERAAAAVHKLLAAVKPHVESRDYKKAKAAVEAALQGESAEAARQRISELGACVDRLVEFWSAVEQGAGKLKKEETVSVRGTSGKFLKFVDGKIHIDAGGVEMGRTLMELKLSEAASLAKKALDPDAGETQLRLALFYVSDRERETEAARKYFDAAAARGVKTEGYLAFFELFEKGETEAEAEALFVKAKALQSRKDWKRSLEAVMKLEKDYAETRFVKSKAEAIAAHRAALQKGVSGEAEELFRKAVSQFNKAQYQACRETLDKLKKEYQGSEFLSEAKDRIAGLIAELDEKERQTAVAAMTGEGAGFIEDWQVIGPFESKDQEGFAKEYPPEQKMNLKGTYVGKGGKRISWQRARKPATPGLINLRESVAPVEEAAAYAFTIVESPIEMDVQVRGGSDDTMTVWINEEKVLEKAKWYGQCAPDEHFARAQLRKGRNTILLKICQGPNDPRWENGWAFYFRLCDTDGKPLTLKNLMK